MHAPHIVIEFEAESTVNESTFLALMTEILGLDSGALTLSTTLQTMSEWNSMSFMLLLSTLEEQYSKHVKPVQLLMCETPQEILTLIQQA